MSDRITDKHLESMVRRINEATGSPIKPWVRDEAANRNRAQIGNFHISGAYGGVQLHRMHNESGGVSTPLNTGYVTKRALYDAMACYLAGIQIGHLTPV